MTSESVLMRRLADGNDEGDDFTDDINLNKKANKDITTHIEIPIDGVDLISGEYNFTDEMNLKKDMTTHVEIPIADIEFIGGEYNFIDDLK